MKKRGQITIFIIMGILILASVGLFFYYKTVMSNQGEALSSEFMPVRDYIDICIERTAMEGLTTLGINGGFITFPSEIEASPFNYLSTSPVPGLKNPYWWHNGINSTPTLDFMRSQLSEYVTSELSSCLNDFSGLKEDYEIKPLGNIVTVSKINQMDVSFDVTYPLLVTGIHNNTRVRMEKFNILLPVRLKEMYELANTILGSQFREAFIEKKVIDLLSVDTDIPTTDIELSCKKKEWNMESTAEKLGIRDKLKNLLTVNIPYIRVANTKYSSSIFVPMPDDKTPETYANSYYGTHYIWYATEKKYPDTHVGFTYDSKWPLELRAFPSDGRILRSNSQKGTELLSSFCLHIWHFTYDISFPVKLTLYDEKTPEHDEFSFIFAFKTSINHNKPDRVSLSSIQFRTREIADSEEFCADTSNKITIIAEDSSEKTSLDNINVKFICGGFECELGKTETDFSGDIVGEAFLRKELPYCVAGYIQADGENYLKSEIPIQTDKDRTYLVPMTPVKTITKYRVVKHSFDGKIVGTEEELSSDERVSITITNKDKSFESVGIYPGEQMPLQLLAGDDFKYDVTVYLLKDENVIGGYVSEWTPSWSQLENSEQIIFHAMEHSTNDENERFLFIGSLSTYSGNVPAPELK